MTSSESDLKHEAPFLEVECILPHLGKSCGSRFKLRRNDKGRSGRELIFHLEGSHRIHLANIQPVSLTNIYSKSPFFVVRDTNDEEMRKWVVKESDLDA